MVHRQPTSYAPPRRVYRFAEKHAMTMLLPPQQAAAVRILSTWGACICMFLPLSCFFANTCFLSAVYDMLGNAAPRPHEP